uniref:RWD domain-containing protein n=2 Tax=Macrostomum lignano TaxID=282301 RepID=A0A1I8IQM8_9PLAT
ELGPDEIASAERAFQRLGLLSKKQACNAALLAKQDEAKKSAGGGGGATGKSAASAASVGASVAAELAGVGMTGPTQEAVRRYEAKRQTAAATVSDCLAESLQLERRRAAIGDAWKPVVLELLLSCAKEVEDRQGCMRRQMNSFVLRQKQGPLPFKVITPCQTCPFEEISVSCTSIFGSVQIVTPSTSGSL